MLCSNCSNEVKPIVAVDIDGTLADYHGHFLYFAEQWLGTTWSGRAYRGDEPFSDWFCDRFGVSRKDWHDVKLAYRQGGLKRTMPIFPDAKELCQEIREEGAELWVTTTRPYLSLDNIVPDTVEWLRRNGINYDGMLFDEDKYTQLADRVDSRRVVAVLDDLSEMCEAAAQVLHYGHDVPILVVGQYNSNEVSSWSTVCDLGGSIDLVLDRIRWWKEKHGSST